jgi:hypothetical protein
MKSVIFWDVTLYNLMKVSHCFGGTCHLQLVSCFRLFSCLTFPPLLRWRAHVSQKHWPTFTRVCYIPEDRTFLFFFFFPQFFLVLILSPQNYFVVELAFVFFVFSPLSHTDQRNIVFSWFHEIVDLTAINIVTYILTVDRVWIGNYIYWILWYTTCDFTLQITVTQTHSCARACKHTHSLFLSPSSSLPLSLAHVLSHSLHQSSGNGFQRQTFSILTDPSPLNCLKKLCT